MSGLVFVLLFGLTAFSAVALSRLPVREVEPPREPLAGGFHAADRVQTASGLDGVVLAQDVCPDDNVPFLVVQLDTFDWPLGYFPSELTLITTNSTQE